ncbi:MAG: hypothetical protein K5683_10785 [Prevotella sp.]|nr:hypothetical protein [Prevotella sp.]
MMKYLLFLVSFLFLLPGRSLSQNDHTDDYDFCEPNADGTMLYYRYVEQAHAPYWSNFNNIVEDVTAIDEVMGDKTVRQPKPIKRLVGDKICIESSTFGTVSIDGRKVLK